VLATPFRSVKPRRVRRTHERFMVPGYLWVIFTVTASGAQTLRNAMQRELISSLGTVGATHVRFLFGLPVALMFLGLVQYATGIVIVPKDPVCLSWIAVGASTQIVATALMLATMKDRSFVVTTAYTKTEPVQVAVFATAFLGERSNGVVLAAIFIATFGVMLMSWPGSLQPNNVARAWRPALLGMVAGGFFALSAIGFRAGILSLHATSFVAAASTTLVAGLAMQTFLLSAYLIVFDRATFVAIGRAWRPSLLAGFMGAFASQFWFLAFAIANAASVRTLALVEMIFAQIVSRRAFSQTTSRRELAGMALIVIGVVLLLNG
jgi:drug/metabolite transporter (DMT)-like permease